MELKHKLLWNHVAAAVVTTVMLAMLGSLWVWQDARAEETSKSSYIKREIDSALGFLDTKNPKRILLSKFLAKQLSLTYPLIVKYANEHKPLTEAEAERVGFLFMTELRNRSALVLSPEEQVTLLDLSLRATKFMTHIECARYIKKQRTDETPDGREIYMILAEMSIEDLKKYTELHALGMDILLSRKGSLASVTDEKKAEIRKNLIALITQRANDDVYLKRLIGGKDFSEMQAEEVCKTGQSLIRVILNKDKYLNDRVVLYLQGTLL